MSNVAGTPRFLATVMVLTALILPGQVKAQDLEPRRWGHLPTDLNMVGIGYAYTDAFVYFSPFWKITNTSARINSYAVNALHTFDLAGKSARVGFLLPFVSGRWEGDVDNQFEVVHRNGFADPRLRLSVNLYGAPALKGKEYARYRAEHTSNTVVGASVALSAPFGQYYEDELINIGGNRWVVRPQIGVVRGHGGRLWPVLSDQRSRIRIRDCPRSRSGLNGTGLTEHPVLVGLDRASCPIALNPSGYSALQSSHGPYASAVSEPWCTPFS